MLSVRNPYEGLSTVGTPVAIDSRYPGTRGTRGTRVTRGFDPGYLKSHAVPLHGFYSRAPPTPKIWN
eukprot:2525817-Rhodomonas_salina.1